MVLSGTEGVKNAIKNNKLLTMSREYPPGIPVITKESGKARVAAAPGDYYFEGEIIEAMQNPVTWQ
jgi:hypothetical protein